MAINRADILARTFTLPEQPAPVAVRQPAGGGAGQYDSEYFGIPKPAEGLQWTDNVGELSNRYYQKLSALDQFAKSMWLNNKIDVTKPDFTNQQAVLAAQAYQQELGNIMSLADELKQSQTMLKSGYDASLTGNYDLSPYQGDQPYARVAGTRAGGTFTGMTEPFQESVQNYSGARETSTIMNRDQAEFEQRMQAMEAQAQQLAQTNPDAAKNLMDQVTRARMAQNMYVNPPAVPSPSSAPTTSVGNLNDLVSVATGAHASYAPSRTIIDGVRANESTENPYVGQTIFGKKVVSTLRTPKDFYLKYSDGTTRKVDPNNIYDVIFPVMKNTGQEPQLEAFVKEGLRTGKIKQKNTEYGPTYEFSLDKVTPPDVAKAAKEITYQETKAAEKAAEEDIKAMLSPIVEYNKKGAAKFFKMTPDPVEFKNTSWGPGYKVVVTRTGDGKVNLKFTDDSGIPVTKDGEGKDMPKGYVNKTIPADDIDGIKSFLDIWEVKKNMALDLEPISGEQKQQAQEKMITNPTPGEAITVNDKQMRAIEAFRKQFNREPSTTEIEKIKAKYK